eukprot:Polyplicarium_translucidae@DN1142_c0_g1_i1.p1
MLPCATSEWRGGKMPSRSASQSCPETPPAYVHSGSETVLLQEKTLYRRALSRMKLGDNEKANGDIRALLQTYPNNKEARTLLAEMELKRRQSEGEALPRTSVAVLNKMESTKESVLSAIGNLQQWMRSRKSRDVLLREGVANAVSRFCVGTTASESVETEVESWKLLFSLVTDQRDDENEDGLNSLTARDPIAVPEDLKRARAAVLGSLGGFTAIDSAVKRHVARGVCTSSGGAKRVSQDALSRTRCCCLALEVAQYVGYTESGPFLDLADRGLRCVESEDVQSSALRCLGYNMRLRQQLGRKTTALLISQPLKCCLESAMSCCASDALLPLVEFLWVVTLSLLSEKDRPDTARVDMLDLLRELLERYMNLAEYSESDWYLAFNGILFASLANRDAARGFIQTRNALNPALALATRKTPNEPRCQMKAVDVLLLSMEFNEMRAEVLEMGGVPSLLELCREVRHDPLLQAKGAAALARLSCHSEEVRCEVFQADFLRLASTALQRATEAVREALDIKEANTSKPESEFLKVALDLLFFLSTHSAFKEILLEEENRSILLSLQTMAKFAADSKDGSTIYLFCSTIYNLERSREDKERIRKTRDMPDLDSSQMRELETFLDSLPDHAKPKKDGHFDRGPPELAERVRDTLVEIRVPGMLSSFLTGSPPPTANLAALCALCIRLLAQKQSRRGAIVQGGCFVALLKAADTKGIDDDDQRMIRQAVSQLCFSINPNLFSYREALDAVPHLLALMADPYELYQYEALLGLTQLLSVSDGARARVVSGQGLKTLRDCYTEDNPMVRAAAVEALCNLSMVDDLCEFFSSEAASFDLKFLIAIVGDDDNYRAQEASAGALATLSRDPRVCARIASAENFHVMFLQMKNRSDKPPLVQRLKCCLDNVQEVLTQLATGSEADELKKHWSGTLELDALNTLRKCIEFTNSV